MPIAVDLAVVVLRRAAEIGPVDRWAVGSRWVVGIALGRLENRVVG